MAEAAVGMIYPPPDIRGVIDTTAQFVSKHGPEFEARVLREQNNAKFAFLQRGNPYRAYYDQRVSDFKAGRTEEPKPAVPEAIQELKKKEEEKKKKKEHLKMLTAGVNSAAEMQPPPEDQYTIQHPFLAPIDIDIIKTTAQFVARNGQKFLVGLTQKEAKNPQFDFLKPTHQLFGYFTALTDTYTKCLMPEKVELEKLKRYNDHPMVFLNQSLRRFEYERSEFRKAQDQEQTHAAERDAFAQIDWHDFVVVETIEFTAEDEGLQLSAPLMLDQLTGEVSAASGAAPQSLGVLERNRIIDEDEAMDIEMEGMDEEDEPAEVPEPVKADSKPEDSAKPAKAAKPHPADDDALPLPQDDEPMFVVKGYSRGRKVEATSATGLLKCPITGQMVPADDMTGHLKILLLDPKWKKQKDQLLERARKESAFDDNVEQNLAGFVSKRPDLFGDVEAQIRQHGEESAEAAAREAGADAGPAHATFGHLTRMREALEQEKLPAPKSTLPALPSAGGQLALPTAETETGETGPRQVMLTNPRLDGKTTAPTTQEPVLSAIGAGEDDDDEDDEPSAKRRKFDASALQPADAWLASHPTAKILVQVITGGAMGSNTVTIDAALSMRVSEFKAKLTAAGVQIQPMRLRHQQHGWMLKDDQTLAYYNLSDGTVLEVKARERGGRK